MSPKKTYDGVIAIDPSFKGMAYTIYIPSLKYKRSLVYDIRGGYKTYDRSVITIRLVTEHIKVLVQDVGVDILELIDVLVIENQFKPKLERLQRAIMNQLIGSFPAISKVVETSAFTWRHFFGLSHPEYRERKKLSVACVKNNPQLKCSENWTKDDNICESILLLNHCLSVKRPQLSKFVEVIMDPATSHINCTTCNRPLYRRESSSQKNPGRIYLACGNRQCADKNAFVGFEDVVLKDEDVQEIPPPTPQRKYPNKRPGPSAGYNKSPGGNKYPPSKQSVSPAARQVQEPEATQHEKLTLKCLITIKNNTDRILELLAMQMSEAQPQFNEHDYTETRERSSDEPHSDA